MTAALSVLATTARRDTLITATKGDVSRLLADEEYMCGRCLHAAGPRCNRGDGAGANLSTCLCLHAEENALLEAGRERLREGAILYCDTYGRPAAVYTSDILLTDSS